jgi:hypothetical protein
VVASYRKETMDPRVVQHRVSGNCVRSSTELLHSGLSLSNAVCASDWTCGLDHAKKIVSDNFSAGMECLC